MDIDILREWNRAFTGGPIVTCFFVLSGFLAWLSFEKRGNVSWQFAVDKIRKFYPTYLCCFVISLTALSVDAVGVRGGTSSKDIFNTLLLHLTLMQALVPTDKTICAYCSTSWYLSCLLFLYFLAVPIRKAMLIAINRNEQKKGTYIIIACWLILFLGEMFVLAYKYKTPFMYEFPLFRICEFWGGMIIGCIYGQEPDNWKKRDHVRLSVLVWLISMYVFHNLGVTGWKYMVSETPFCMILIYQLAKKRSDRILKLYLTQILLYISRYSLEIFLLHYSVLRYFKFISIPSFGVALIYCAMSMLITIKLAELVHAICRHNIEKAKQSTY